MAVIEFGARSIAARSTTIAAVIEPAILAAIACAARRALAPPPIRYRPLRRRRQRRLVDDVRAPRGSRDSPHAFHVDADGARARARARRRAVAHRCAGGGRRCAARRKARCPPGATSATRSRRRSARRRCSSSSAAPRAISAFARGRRTSTASCDVTASRRMWLARRSRDEGHRSRAARQSRGRRHRRRLSRRRDACVKEAWEEAGIDGGAGVAPRVAAGIVHVRRVAADGLQRETIFVHDLACRPTFVPDNQDGEAIEHRLVDARRSRALIAIDAGIRRDDRSTPASSCSTT